MKRLYGWVLLGSGVCALAGGSVFADGWESTSRATNRNGITNTRHNLTMSYLTQPALLSSLSTKREIMDASRNDYREVCVYCHTPHGANASVSAPLWNRTIKANTYSVYAKPLMSGQTATQPGIASLTCLSCHDGTVAIDSVINMPGSSRYDAGQSSNVSDAFLDTWTNSSGRNTNTHAVMNTSGSVACAACHNFANLSVLNDVDNCNKCHTGTPESHHTTHLKGFNAYVIGTDLNNDHPVGVQYPTHFTSDVDFYPPTGETVGKMSFFDTNGDGRADTNEVRMYDTSGVYEVECASCHDPHGVPSAGPGSLFIPSFLRVSNATSGLCLTCHIK